MAPVVHGLEDKYVQYLPFYHLDIDDPATLDVQIALDYSRNWRPYILLIDSNGEIQQIYVGVIGGLEIEQSIQDLLNSEGIFVQ